jgi:hypothetical protein
LLEALGRLVDPATRGDPMSPLRWTCKSTTQLAGELTRQGHPVSPRTVGRLLKADGYSLQSNRKTKEGGDHPDRDAQFEHINATVTQFQRRGQPVISIDTKKKELVGDFKNGGREWQPQGEPEEVRVHDFLDEDLGKAIPYGVYDIGENQGWVSVGIDHDTARFATEAIRRWWSKMGAKRYRSAKALLITTDGAAATAVGAACGKSLCRIWRPGWGFPFMCGTSHRAPATGTGSNTGGSATSHRSAEKDDTFLVLEGTTADHGDDAIQKRPRLHQGESHALPPDRVLDRLDPAPEDVGLNQPFWCHRGTGSSG